MTDPRIINGKEVDKMAAYLALGIEEKRLDYHSIVTNARYTRFKDDIDAILIADGFQNLIVG
jgi:hypothetical protein